MIRILNRQFTFNRGNSFAKAARDKLRLIVLTGLILTGFTPHLAWAVAISVSVDRNPVTVDESFSIIFTAPDTPDGEPDFSPLAQDFTVVNQSQSSNSSWINGQYSKSVRWTVQAIAKKSGALSIPAISFGNDASKPLPITVNKADASDDGVNTNQELFIQVKAEPESPYVQAQVRYNVRVYRRVDLAQAKLTEPVLTDAVVEKLGNDSEFSTVINGVSYTVTERTYAIFPQKSGELKIAPLALTADVVVDDDGRGGFGGFFGSPITKTKRVLSNEIRLTVKPIPANFAGKTWLPAEKLELAQTWSGNIQQMQAGEPMTRTLTVRGTGTTISQLPELNNLTAGHNFKIYPDQPVLNEEKLPEGVSASRQEKIALIPAVAGKHTLPAVEIPWFNVKTQRAEVARIPETTLAVIGDAVVNPTEPAPLAQQQPKPQSAGISDVPAKTAETSVQAPVVNLDTKSNFWQWLSLLLGLGWLTTLVYVFYRRSKLKVNNRLATDKEQPDLHLKDLSKQLKIACLQNDALTAKNVLLAWGKHQFNVNSLGAIASHCDAQLMDEILALNQFLYGKDAVDWNGKKLFQAFSENSALKKISHTEDLVLEPLHRL